MEYKIYSSNLANGMVLSSCAIEIISIPDVGITPFENETEARAAYAADVARTLTSMFDVYKTYIAANSEGLTTELLWASTPVKNQTYAAKIRLVFYLRAMSSSKQASEALIKRAADVLTILLEIDKYTFTYLQENDVKDLIQNADFSSKQAIVRVVRTESLPIPNMQTCLHFDCFNITPPTLEILANVLIKIPNSLVSFQLIPTRYSDKETQNLASVCQTLGMLSSGLHDPSFGMIPVVSAQKCVDTYAYYNDNSNKALFYFNVAVYGPAEGTGMITFAVQSVLSGAGKTSLSVFPLSDVPAETIKSNYAGNPWMLQQYLQTRYPSTGVSQFDRMPYIVTADEAVTMLSLPVAGKNIGAGFTVDHTEKQGKEYRSSMVDSGDIRIGKLKSTGGNHTFGISRNDLTKHMLVVGTPGSGKTTFSVGMLDRLWKQGVPFLVIEPAKNEYRALVQSIPDLQVFTPGKNSISPFVFNPFVLPDNVRLESYKSTLKTAFAAGVSMTPPLDKIFEETINNCYADFGWLDTYTSSDKGKVFNIYDFINCFQKTFDAIGYMGEVGNIGKAGIVRLKGLAKLFDNYYSVPIGDLLKKPTVIELAAIENSDEKALIIALLLLSILSYVNANYTGDSGLRNVILLEEAHVLLDAQSISGQGEANPSQIAQGLVKRMLAELRSYGISLVIADQSPRKVTTDVVALTDVKLAFRLVESADKQIIAESTNMSAQQESRLSRLRPGEAFFFFNKLEEPEEVMTENYRLENKIDITLSDAEIARLSTYWKERQQLLRPYPECAYSKHCQHQCDYSRRILAKEIARRIFNHYILTAKVQSNSKKDIIDAQKTAIKQVLSQIITLSRNEAPDEEISPELLICIKLHLFRKIKYETSIQFGESMIQNSLTK